MSNESIRSKSQEARLIAIRNAIDAFFEWLSAHEDEVDIGHVGQWELHQLQFLEAVKMCTDARRALLLLKMKGR
jgi:hypothetical protein